MFSHFTQKHFFRLLTGVALAFCLMAGPAHAKKTNTSDTSEKGGLFQPPAPIAKPNLVLDTSIPKVLTRKGDELRQNAPDVMPATPAVSVVPTAQSNNIVPVKSFEPAKDIESMRLHSLFE